MSWDFVKRFPLLCDVLLSDMDISFIRDQENIGVKHILMNGH